MIKKKAMSLVIVAILTISLIVPVFAYSTINVWASNLNYVSYTPYDGSYYVYNYSTNSSFTTLFINAVYIAAARWQNVLPVNVVETSVNYALNSVHGGTRSQLLSMYPDLTTGLTGLTYVFGSGSTSTVTYAGSNKTVERLRLGSRMCVVEKPNRTQNGYTNTAIHEMGHLFGWAGHSPYSTDIMYSYATEITSLTYRDRTHLSQIYDIFY